MDDGKFVEDGTYDELIAKGRYFAELVERQRLDKEKNITIFVAHLWRFQVYHINRWITKLSK
jgi:hypothetical protein